MTALMEHQTACPKAIASVFLFFPPAHVFKTILGSPTNGTFDFAPTPKADLSAKAKKSFFAVTPKKQLNKIN